MQSRADRDADLRDHLKSVLTREEYDALIWALSKAAGNGQGLVGDQFALRSSQARDLWLSLK